MKRKLNIGKLIADIESSFQVALTVAILFPSLVFSLSVVAEVTAKESNNVILNLSTSIGLYLLSYVFFVLSKNSMQYNWLRATKALLLCGITAYVFPILLITLYKNGPIYNLFGWVLYGFLWTTLLIPLGLLLCVAFSKRQGK